MTAANDALIAKIDADPNYHALKRQRNTLGWTLTALMLLAYYGYIGLIAFDKQFLAKPIGEGVTTIGIPIAIGVMVFAILITGFYVRRANRVFDQLTAQILEDAHK